MKLNPGDHHSCTKHDTVNPLLGAAKTFNTLICFHYSSRILCPIYFKIGKSIPLCEQLYGFVGKTVGKLGVHTIFRRDENFKYICLNEAFGSIKVYSMVQFHGKCRPTLLFSKIASSQVKLADQWYWNGTNLYT